MASFRAYDCLINKQYEILSKNLRKQMYPNYTEIQKTYNKPVFRVYEHKDIPCAGALGLNAWLNFHETHDKEGNCLHG